MHDIWKAQSVALKIYIILHHDNVYTTVYVYNGEQPVNSNDNNTTFQKIIVVVTFRYCHYLLALLQLKQTTADYHKPYKFKFRVRIRVKVLVNGVFKVNFEEVVP